MKKITTLLTGVLAASFLMPANALAAGPGISLSWDKTKETASVYISGLSGNVTGAEVTLSSKQNLSGTVFQAQKDTVYGHIKTTGDSLTIYVDAVSIIDNDNGKIYLGDLTVSDGITFSSASDLIVVDENDASIVYHSVGLENRDSENDEEDPGNDVIPPGDSNGGNDTTPPENSNDGNDTSSPGGNHGGTGSGGESSSGTNSLPSSSRPVIAGSLVNGSITFHTDGSITIRPHDGYEIKEVLLNGISMGAVTRLYDLTSDDEVQVFFTPIVKEPSQPESAPNRFLDVPNGQWYAPSVSYVTERGLFSGVSETEFAPMSSMTRGMLVSVLYRMEGTNDTGNTPFHDVAPGAWYEKAVGWAYANQVVSGVTKTTFAPDAPIKREDAAVMLTRYLRSAGITLESGTLSFTDNNSISQYAKESVAAMQKARLLSGDDTGNFHPKAQITRAEIASIFMRMCQKYGI